MMAGSGQQIVVSSAITLRILQELFEQSQIGGKWHDAIKAIQRKHNRHADELQALEEVLKNLRSVGAVFIFSVKDDSFIILPLTMTT